MTSKDIILDTLARKYFQNSKSTSSNQNDQEDTNKEEHKYENQNSANNLPFLLLGINSFIKALRVKTNAMIIISFID